MKREQYTSKSKALGQDLSMIVYGEKGYPVVAFQTQNAKCGEFEEKGMVETLAPFIDAGQIQLFSVDNIDEQSWSLYDGDKNARAERQEDYFRFVTDELVPRVHEFNGTSRRPLAVGCSMGAVHAALAAMRRPDLFQGCISLSGVYRSNHFYGDWMSSTLYNNDITAFLPNMAKDHPYVDIYNKRQIVFCVGQGEDDGIGDVRFINDQLNRLGVDHWCDFWGRDVSHDWFWWTKQMSYFLPFVLEDIEKTTAGEKFETVKKPAAKKAAAKKPAAKKAAAKKPAAKKAAAKPAAKKAATKTAAKPAAKKAAPKAAAKPAVKAAAPKAAAKPAVKAAPKAAAPKAAAKPAVKAAPKAAAKPVAKAAAPKAAAKPAAKAAAPKAAAKPAAKAAAPKAAAKPAVKAAAPKAAAKPAAKTAAPKAAAKPAVKAAAPKAAAKPAVKAAPKVAAKPAAKAAAPKAATKPAVKPAAKPAVKPAAKPAAKPTAAKPAAKPATKVSVKKNK
ncbi:alpha/beta hydrolase [Olsenella intestinalis]|uniref:alpha/beta hydrolase n=1 Tax=Olsenella intestinalis TaxID=2930083 RepID=UPI0020103C21